MTTGTKNDHAAAENGPAPERDGASSRGPEPARGDTRASGPAPGTRVTMKDVAARLGVSINTVHKAIAGKPGLSDALRAKVIATASDMGYRRNEGASNLSRKDIRLVACLPSPQREGSYFYAYLWEGCRRFAAESRDSGVVLEAVEFGLGEYPSALRSLAARVEAGEAVGGLLAFAPTTDEERSLLARLAEAGVSVLLLDGDCDSVDRLGAVITNYAAAGRLMAEQAENLLAGADAPRVLLLSGDESTDSHRLVAQAFVEGLAAQRPDARVVELPGAHAQADVLRASLAENLASGPAPQLVCSVSAVGTDVVVDVLGRKGMPAVRAIGNDLFPESAAALRDGLLTNLVYKDPVGMAYRAAKTLGDFLLWGKRPARDVQMGPVQLVFRSNLAQYCAAAGVEDRPAAARAARG